MNYEERLLELVKERDQAAQEAVDLRDEVARLRQRLTEMERGSISGVCRELRLQLDAAEARVAEYERILADPAAVWANMLTGKIARPMALEHYEECKARVEELEAENAETDEDPELDEMLDEKAGASRRQQQSAVLRWAAAVLPYKTNSATELHELADAIERGEAEI